VISFLIWVPLIVVLDKSDPQIGVSSVQLQPMWVHSFKFHILVVCNHGTFCNVPMIILVLGWVQGF
jgi:hypothetical protein